MLECLAATPSKTGAGGLAAARHQQEETLVELGGLTRPRNAIHGMPSHRLAFGAEEGRSTTE